MMRGNRMYLIAATAIIAVAVTLFCWHPWMADGDPKHNRSPHNRSDNAVSRQRLTKAHRGPHGNQVELGTDAFIDLPLAERKLAEAVQTALDNDDYDATLKAATKALNSTNVSLRLHAVEALGWFGKRALAEITPCMADPDEEVAQAAVNAWELGLSEIDSAKDRFDISLMALTTISEKDALRTIGCQFSNAATDILEEIEDEKTASDKRVEIIQSVADMICGDQSARSETAREIYEDITGHEWVSVEEAELYLSNPDTYESPEDRKAEETSTGSAATSETVPQ